jgi:membrane protease YdiL (CAAX protease family)
MLAAADEETAPEVISVTALLANSIFIWLFLVGVPVFATRVKGNGLVADLGLRVRPVDGLAFVVGVVLQAIVVPLLYWPLLPLFDRTSDDVESEARRLVDGTHGAGVALLVLIVCVGAPFAEELFFRGLTQRAVLKRWGRPAVAVALSSLVFGVSHLQGLQLPALLVFAVVAGALAQRTGRLGTSILCHAGFNAWTLFVLLVLDR